MTRAERRAAAAAAAKPARRGAAAKAAPAKTGRRGAAVTFLEVVRESLTFMAKHARHTEFVSGRIARAEQYQAYFAESEVSEKAAFVQRMKDAKAAKAQRANGGAA